MCGPCIMRAEELNVRLSETQSLIKGFEHSRRPSIQGMRRRRETLAVQQDSLYDVVTEKKKPRQQISIRFGWIS